MIKAVLLPLGFLLLLAAALPAQNNGAADMAVRRAVMDQANTILLRQKLEDAKSAAAQGDLTGAAKIYEDAKELVDQIGSGIDAETAQTISGLVGTRLELARRAQHDGNLPEADTQVTRALRVDPHNVEALDFKKRNDQIIASLKGRIPDPATLERVPQVAADKTAAGTLVQDGKVLYEMGKFEEAGVKLNQALKLDPDNPGAFYYLGLVQQANFARAEHNRTTQGAESIVEVSAAWSPKVGINLPVPNPYVTNTDIHTGVGREVIYRKLNSIQLDTISWPDGRPLSEVIHYLAEESRLRDPAKTGINFIFNPNVDAASVPGATGGPGGPGGPGAFPGAAPAQLNPATGLQEQPAPGGTATTVDASTINVKLAMNNISLHNALDAIVMVAQDLPPGIGGIKYSVEEWGVVLSPNPSGAQQPTLEIRVFKVDPNTFYEGLQNVSSQSFGGANSSTGNGGGGGNFGGGGGGGGNFGGGGGGNFGGNNGGNNGGNFGGGGNGGGATVPTVLVTGGGGGGGGNFGGGGGGNFGGGGGRGGGGGGGNFGGGGINGGGGGIGGGTGVGGLSYINPSSSQVQSVAQVALAFFNAIGVNLAAVGRSIAFNDKQGVLVVKATPSELDTVERVVQALNQVAPQVHIKTRFIEISQGDNTALGLDWFLGQFGTGGGTVAQAGTSPSLTVPTSEANPNLGSGSAFPGQTTANLIAGAASDQQLTSGLRNTGPAIATLTGIFTDPNFRVVLHMLEQRTGVSSLAEPEAVTTSGRQTQMRATDIQNILTGFSFQTGTPTTGTGPTTGLTGTTVQATPNSAITPNTQQFEIGPTLDVVPYVLSDGYTVNLTLIPQVLQFLQYDPVPTVPGYTPAVSSTSGGVSTLPTVLPHFTVRSVVTTVNIWDNQTVVLGGLISSSINTTKDKVPFLADLPLLGRLFQSQTKTLDKKNLMIFVTATIVDPAGNRVHSDDDVPFNPMTIPVQPVGATMIGQTNGAAIINAPRTVSERSVTLQPIQTGP